jgi:hypothetical protein
MNHTCLSDMSRPGTKDAHWMAGYKNLYTESSPPLQNPSTVCGVRYVRGPVQDSIYLYCIIITGKGLT